MRCQETRDGGASRIRGYHNRYPCTNEAKWKVTYNWAGQEVTTCVCGCHKNKLIRAYSNAKVEKLSNQEN